MNGSIWNSPMLIPVVRALLPPRTICLFSVFQIQKPWSSEEAAIEPENPYWNGKSQTFEDPEAWRVVLYDGSPFGSRG
jgi:hypothetical protein